MSNDFVRQQFELWHAEEFPFTNVTRKGEGYTKQSVNNRWEVWKAAHLHIKTPQPNPGTHHGQGSNTGHL